MSDSTSSQVWDIEIKAKPNFFQINLKEIWKYRDLLIMFIRRDFVTVYKQTILGPLWFFIQPILTTFTFVIIFGEIAQIKTGDIPQVLFYMSGVTIWNYFSDTLLTTSKTFTENASVFGKVYFPRIILPLSKVFSGLIKFLIQFLLFLVFFIYFYLTTDNIHPNWTILLLPFYISIMAVLGLGLGIIFSSLTTKYRDLTFLISFGIQLLMYATPVIYPLSKIPSKYLIYIQANPMTAIVERFRFSFLGTGDGSWTLLIYSATISVVIFCIGILLFNRVEKSFMDTV
jgi:lipopolysaccharide transport system permease protein